MSARPLKSGDPHEVHMLLSRLERLLAGHRYRYSSEVRLHAVLAQVIADEQIAFQQEVRLDEQNRVDFLVWGRIVIEVKVDGSFGDALRQVERYIHLPEVQGVLLATTTRWGDQPLVSRPAWQGKPFQMVRLERQAL